MFGQKKMKKTVQKMATSRRDVMLGLFAVFGLVGLLYGVYMYGTTVTGLAVIPVGSADFTAMFVDLPADNFDTQGTVPTDGANVTLNVYNITGLPAGIGIGIDRVAYLELEVDGGATEYIAGFSTFEIKEHSGSTIHSYIRLDSVEFQNDDGDELVSLTASIPIDKDDEIDTSVDTQLMAGTEIYLEMSFEMFAEPASAISAEIGWDVNVKAVTSADDDEFRGSVIAEVAK